MERKNCGECYCWELYYIEYSFHRYIFTALYSTIIKDEDRVNYMKMIVEDHFKNINNKDIQSLVKCKNDNCKYGDIRERTKDIYKNMKKISSLYSMADIDKYFIIKKLNAEHFEIIGNYSNE